MTWWDWLDRGHDSARELLAVSIGAAGCAREVAGDLATAATWIAGVAIEDLGQRVQRWARSDHRGRVSSSSTGGDS